MTPKTLTVLELLQWQRKATELREASWLEEKHKYIKCWDECIEASAPSPEINEKLGLMIWSLKEHCWNDSQDWLHALENS